jgi:hypothetical protein
VSIKQRIVIFGENGARIQTVEDVSVFLGREDVLINPNLSRVRGVPPHFWMKDGSEIGVKDNDEGFHVQGLTQEEVDTEVLAAVSEVEECLEVLERDRRSLEVLVRAQHAELAKKSKHILIACGSIATLVIAVGVKVYLHVCI